MNNGDLKIWSVEGNHQWLDGGAMFGSVPRALWSRWYQPDDQGRIRLACRCLLVKFGDKTILCETGIGAFMEPKLRERFGVESDEHLLLQNLKKLNVAPDDIDYVILSHLHFDHAGGLLPAYDQLRQPVTADQLLFPKATYIAGDDAFARALQPHARDRASFIPGLATALEDSGRLQLVHRKAPKSELGDAFGFFFTDGHTPGQMHTVVHGPTQSVVFAGDLIPGTAWVHLPVTMGYDRFPEKLIDEKRDLYERFADRPWSLFYTHDPELAGSRVGFDDTKKKYIPVEEVAEFSGLVL